VLVARGESAQAAESYVSDQKGKWENYRPPDRVEGLLHLAEPDLCAISGLAAPHDEAVGGAAYGGPQGMQLLRLIEGAPMLRLSVCRQRELPFLMLIPHG